MLPVDIRVRFRSFLFSLVLGAASARACPEAVLQASAQRPGREVSLSRSEVKDSFFAYVIGIIRSGLEVDIDGEQMREILTEFKTALILPFDLVARVSQRNAPSTGKRTISLRFRDHLIVPIPFSLLGYHPGVIRASEEVSFRVTPSAYRSWKDVAPSSPVFDLTLTGGEVLVDVDDWLVYLLGFFLDKVQVRHIVFFIYRGEWIGLLEGAGLMRGRDMRAYFNFTRNSIVFPVPGALDAMGIGLMAAVAP